MASGETRDANLVEDKTENLECAVCLQTCIHPAQLPCGHIFCYLCIKGIANQSKKCAMCRQEIPRDFTDQPNLLNGKPTDTVDTFDGCYQWFYEGRNGWWKYDKRTNEEIEQAYNLKQTKHELLICGQLYVVDFDAKVQYPKSDAGKKRSIKRDLVDNVTLKGVAGLR